MSSSNNNNSTSSFEDILDKFNNLVASKRGKALSEAEEIIIRGTWNNESYNQMAKNSDYTVNYLQRTLASRFFTQLSRSLGEEVNKNNLKVIIEKLTDNDSDDDSSKYLNKVRGCVPPDISNFYGRANEIAHLKNLVLNGNHCIYLIGVAGIGKSALAAKVMADISLEKKSQFNCFVWKSVSHQPLLKDLVTELLALVDPVHNFSGLPENIHSRISILIKLLQKKSCLVVLDDFSANTDDEAGYQSFLRRLVEEQHNSCFILASRKLEDITKELIQARRSIDSFKLEGLDKNAAMQLLFAQGLTNEPSCHELIDKYRGNPSELEAVALKISNLFGSEKAFLQNPTTLISNKMVAILDEMFAKQLTGLQTQILSYIAAIDESSIGLTKLLQGLKKRMKIISTSEIINALEKLEQYSLLEKRQSAAKEMTFAIQPTIKKYIKINQLSLKG